MAYFSIKQLCQEKSFIKEGFLGLQSLAGPVYTNNIGWDWVSDSGFLGSHDDLLWEAAWGRI